MTFLNTSLKKDWITYKINIKDPKLDKVKYQFYNLYLQSSLVKLNNQKRLCEIYLTTGTKIISIVTSSNDLRFRLNFYRFDDILLLVISYITF